MRLLSRFIGRNKDALFNRGVTAAEHEDYEGAAKLFKKVCEMDETDGEAFHCLGMCCVEMGEYKRAAECLSRYFELCPDEVYSELRELASTIEKAITLDTAAGRSLVREFLKTQEERASIVEMGGRKMSVEDLLKMTDGLCFDDSLRTELSEIKELRSKLSGKTAMRFYSIKGFSPSLQDSHGFADAFFLTGYAVARASIKLVGRDSYLEQVSECTLKELTVDGIVLRPLRKSLLSDANPLPWSMVSSVLEYCVEVNTHNIVKRFPNLLRYRLTVQEHLVREFLYLGYSLGLMINAAR